MTAPSPAPTTRSLRRTAALCGALALGMVGLAYASVPLYDLFCRATGFGGTPVVRASAPAASSDRTVAVRLDSNVAPGLRWRFTPEVDALEVKLGEPQTVMFKVTNTGTAASTGIATFNVQPDRAGGYFVKTACFCFNEHTLKAGESMESAVVFYVDPDLAKNRGTRDIGTITLSYTYFPSKNGEPLTTAASKE